MQVSLPFYLCVGGRDLGKMRDLGVLGDLGYLGGLGEPGALGGYRLSNFMPSGNLSEYMSPPMISMHPTYPSRNMSSPRMK